MQRNAVNILICSAGRRNYLVRWFREALASAGQPGSIVVADANPHAPAQREADHFESMPSFSKPDYLERLSSICDHHRIDLAISLNDFELSHWARLDELARVPTIFHRLEPNVQTIVEDKLALEQTLQTLAIKTPPTISVLQWCTEPQSLQVDGDARLIVKNRYGSGSAGLITTTTQRLREDLEPLLRRVHGRDGTLLTDRSTAAAALIIQPQIDGVEYGLDLISNFQTEHAGTLVREKLRMRHGETDSAITTRPDDWLSLASTVSEAVPHQGILDMDVIRQADGTCWTIDINPRFGGGYPFSHMAGANVPRTYVDWLKGDTSAPRHLAYDAGVIATKFIDIASVTTEHA